MLNIVLGIYNFLPDQFINNLFELTCPVLSTCKVSEPEDKVQSMNQISTPSVFNKLLTFNKLSHV
jgi:hypothetical protein